MLPETPYIILAIVIALVVLLPARRLQLAGFSRAVIAVYALGVWALAMILVFRPVLIRFLVPILVVLYLAPFVTAPGRMSGDRPPRPGSPRRSTAPADEERDPAGRTDRPDRAERIGLIG